jgi:predicted glycoside hydrolase/deacetylase ChbG (UPF0249 family)
LKQHRVLIIHADDLGLCPEIDNASFRAFKAGWITSASAIATGPTFENVVRSAAKNKYQFDLGLHLTLTSEWPKLKMRPCSPADKVRSLVDQNGHFNPRLVIANGLPNLGEVELELRAQV